MQNGDVAAISDKKIPNVRINMKNATFNSDILSQSSIFETQNHLY